jgi:hypothetical protein
VPNGAKGKHKEEKKKIDLGSEIVWDLKIVKTETLTQNEPQRFDKKKEADTRASMTRLTHT